MQLFHQTLSWDAIYQKLDPRYLGGASAFTDLTDVPSSYVGSANKLVAVKGDVSGLEFISPPSSVVYPGAGIAKSTGSAWDTSITDNSANWNTAYGWGDHALAGYQAGSDNLTSLSGLTYVSTSFVKMTGANTFTLDTNTYLTSLAGALLADGTVTGATSQAQAFTNGVKSSTLTAGRVTFAGTAGLLSDDSVFTWDNTNKRLGVNFSVPTAKIEASNSGDTGANLIQLTGVNGYSNIDSGGTGIRTVRGSHSSYFGSGGSNVQFGSTTASNVLIFTNNSSSNALLLDTSGRLGIDVASPTAILHLKAGTTSANTAPLKFTSGTSMTNAEAGAMEFTTDDLFFTITTGTTRKRLLMADVTAGLTSGRVPFATTNGRLTDSANMTFSTTAGLLVTGGSSTASTLTSGATTTPAVIAKAIASQSADIVQVQDSSANNLARVDYAGTGYFSGSGQSSLTRGLVVNSGAGNGSLDNLQVHGYTLTNLIKTDAANNALGFFNTTPVAQPTTAVASASLVGGGGTILTDTDTFDGYTLKQVVKALRLLGILQ
jgi:hypothetical protein